MDLEHGQPYLCQIKGKDKRVLFYNSENDFWSCEQDIALPSYMSIDVAPLKRVYLACTLSEFANRHPFWVSVGHEKINLNSKTNFSAIRRKYLTDPENGIYRTKENKLYFVSDGVAYENWEDYNEYGDGVSFLYLVEPVKIAEL